MEVFYLPEVSVKTFQEQTNHLCLFKGIDIDITLHRLQAPILFLYLNESVGGWRQIEEKIFSFFLFCFRKKLSAIDNSQRQITREDGRTMQVQGLRGSRGQRTTPLITLGHKSREGPLINLGISNQCWILPRLNESLLYEWR